MQIVDLSYLKLMFVRTGHLRSLYDTEAVSMSKNKSSKSQCSQSEIMTDRQKSVEFGVRYQRGKIMAAILRCW